jgi:hypothetical protein
LPEGDVAAMTSLFDAIQRLASAPLLERLRFVDGLTPQDDFDARPIIERLAAVDHDERWSMLCVTRVVPPARWPSLLDSLAERDHLVLADACWSAFDHRLVPVLVEARSVERLNILVQRSDLYPNHERLRAELAPAIPDLLAHASDECAAALLAARCGHYGPTVIADLDRRVAGLNEDTGGYDEQVDAEDLLALVARGGPALRSIGRRLGPLLASDAFHLRTAAAVAAVGISDAALAPALQAAFGRRVATDDLAHAVERCVLSYAIWQVGGEPRWFEAAIREAGDNLVCVSRLLQVFEYSSVDAGFLAALAGIAERPEWTASVFQILGRAGAEAAAIVAALPPITVGAEGWVQYLEARWKTGLDAAAALCAALEPHLAWTAWDVYVAADLGTERWRTRIGDELARGTSDLSPPAIAFALVRSPTVAMQFLPELAHPCYDELVRQLWRVVPAETFWSAIDGKARS